MANLLPLHLDKDTGDWVASVTSSGGGTLPPLPAGQFRVIGMSYFQSSPATVWTVVHNGNTQDIQTQIFDTNQFQIIPDNVESVNANTVKIYFTTPMSGKAIVFFEEQ